MTHSTPRALPASGVGLGWRPQLAADLLGGPRDVVDLVEVVAESCYTQPRAWREACAIAEVWPVVPHGVKLSLGSADGIERDRARKLGALARALRAPAVTEHVAFTRGGTREIGHLTQLPRTRTAIDALARNVAAARRELPDHVPLFLENAAWTFRWPDDAMGEGDFYAEVVRATGCDLLLDLGNLYANAVNAGEDPVAVLATYPLEHVAMVHIAGGVEEEGFYFDTHAHAVPDAVFALLAECVRRTGRAVPVVLERDERFPAFGELTGELARARTAGAPPPRAALPGEQVAPVARMRRDGVTAHARTAEREPDLAARDLAARQAALAEMLTDVDPPPSARARPYGECAIARARDVLQKKRVDDALPLVAQTAQRAGDALFDLALACVQGAPRAPRLAGVADALRIADRAASDARFAAAARRDRLALRARFVGPAPDGTIRPRVGPFVGREQMPDGRSVWALKGPGAAASVRLFENRRGH